MKKAIALLAITSLSFVGFAQKKSDNKDEKKQATLSGMSFRAIGPALVSGRVIDMAVNPNNSDEFYIAAASGGVWKTSNHGNTFSPIFDSYGSYSIGCVTIDPNNEHTVWVGTGENNNQRSVAYGDGIYKSVDDGKSFKNMGLPNSEHIAKIIVQPGNSEVVFVAAYGPLWSEGGDRGIYKTMDGGTTWERIFHVSDNTGFSDMWMDPRDPNTMYASAHQRRRHTWTYLSGGPESAIYKTTDGGANWRKINSGLPKADLGRIALAISPANPDVVYAMVEGFDKEHGGFYRSNNRGESWNRQSDYFTSGNYYVELVPDPNNVDKVFSMDTWLHHTEDGGKTFKKTGEKSKHVDNHAMWINPKNTNHWLVGCDGGLYETWDGAGNWKFHQNLNITQFYRVAIDNDLPFYNVYGGTQDNNTLGGPSRTTNAHGISNFDWYITRGGDGFEPQVDPTDPNIVYSQAQYGWLVRFNKATGERVNIKPMERKGEDAYRWNWDAPLIISPHDNKRLYFAANKVFKSDDRGNTWEVISEDLSQQIDRNTLKVMGTTWGPDAVALHKSTTIYGNIVSINESPVQEGLLYAGTDDGLIHMTEDNGGSWKKMNSFPGIPANTYVMDIRGDVKDAGTVYAVFNNHKQGDFKPYILKSTNKGAAWTSITGDLPEKGAIYTLRQDPVDPNLIFVGTEYGVFFTLDGGKKWVQIKGGLPTIAVRDMEIQERESDLVLATFGRGFYVLDNFAPLRNMADTTGKDAHILPIKDALIFNQTNPMGTRGKGSQGEAFFTADNPPIGAVINFYLADNIETLTEARRKAEKKIRKDGGDVVYPPMDDLREEDLEQKPYLLFEIKDAKGNVVSRYTDKGKKGLNKSVWNYRMEPTSPVQLKERKPGRYGSPDWGALVLPGTYSVTIHKMQGGALTQMAGPTNFKVKMLHDKQIVKADKQDLAAFINEVDNARRNIRASGGIVSALKKQADYMEKAVMQTPKADPQILVEIDQLKRDLAEIELAMYGDRTRSKREMESYPGLQGRVETIVYNLYNHTEAPTTFERESLRAAMDEYGAVRPKIKASEDKTALLAKQLTEAGAPYFPR
ncbi:MAG: glycosyl hydrolase [Flavobacteriales bacterium]|nr:glycosyl hydrolase [Flavobacteriales bacterium]